MTQDRPGRLQGKVALVTGAASGIGEATAALFATEGALVYASDLAAPSLPSAGVTPIVLDVASEEHWRDAIVTIGERHGRLDILVNCAGIGGAPETVEHVSIADWNQVIAVNQTGVMLGIREATPLMRAAKGGSIVNISSIWGIAAVPAGAGYHASKAAVRHLSKHAAIALAQYGIRVNSIHPGIVATPMVMSDANAVGRAQTIAATPLGRMARPMELAKACLFLASDDASFVTGAELVVDGGYLAQ